ncbi:DMT family transporter [Crenobacter cavernae]|uniref:DMT family transporter n=1 Tax=Crenobacter cavernae TaxID=2290923 RepID=A0A345Y4K0_9NEIS|nr:DMT family transporter [Crenobacter cavernae]AXK38852.1 DMT family transporter [Crenobacter cavernae]
MTASNPTLTLPPSAGRSLLPDASLVGITLLWGGTFLAVQTALQWAGPFGFVAMRFGMAGLIALLVSFRVLKGLTRAELKAGVIIGGVLFFSYSLQTVGLGHIESSKSAFLTALYVPLVPVIMWCLFRRRPRRAAWLGVAIAFAGLALLADPRGLDFSFGVGEWLTLFGAAAIALEICLVGRYAAQCDPRRVTVVQLFVVSLLAFIGMGATGEAPPVAHPGLIACVVGLGLATALIQIAMNWAQKTVPATRATIIYAMEPVWAGLVGWLAGEHLTVLAVSGAALIVFSVLVSQLGARQGGAT